MVAGVPGLALLALGYVCTAPCQGLSSDIEGARATTERLQSDSERFLGKSLSDGSAESPTRYAPEVESLGPNRSGTASDWVQ